jgi:hypothetical protein
VLTGRGSTERIPDLAFESGGAITRLDQTDEIREFSLP